MACDYEFPSEEPENTLHGPGAEAAEYVPTCVFRIPWKRPVATIIGTGVSTPTMPQVCWYLFRE